MNFALTNLLPNFYCGHDPSCPILPFCLVLEENVILKNKYILFLKIKAINR